MVCSRAGSSEDESTCRQRTSNDRVHYASEHYHRSWSLYELIAKLYKSVKELGVWKRTPHVDRGRVMTVNITLGAGLFTSLISNYTDFLRSWEFGRCVHM